MLFVIPWGAHWIIGTTDTAWDLDKAHPAASRADIDYLLHHVNAVLRDPLDHDDVEGVYAGLRPRGGPSRGLFQFRPRHPSTMLPRTIIPFHSAEAASGPVGPLRRSSIG